MKLAKSTLIPIMFVGPLCLAACERPNSNGVNNETRQKVEEHFATGPKTPVKVGLTDNTITMLSQDEVDKIQIPNTAFLVRCGIVTVVNENLTIAMSQCKALAPDSDMIISSIG